MKSNIVFYVVCLTEIHKMDYQNGFLIASIRYAVSPTLFLKYSMSREKPKKDIQKSNNATGFNYSSDH